MSRNLPGARLGLFLCAALLAGTAHAQQPTGAPAPRQAQADLPTPSLRAVRATGPIRVDGRLDDAAWSTAEPAADFVQRAPSYGSPASQRTEVRVVYDEAALYVAARMFDSSPDSIAAPLIRRDGSIYSDWIEVLVDSYNDQRTGFRFIVNPRGVKRDIYQSNDANEDISWDAVWEVETLVDSLGWTAEFRIPFTQLRFARGAASSERTWGVNFGRIIARKDEFSYWSPIPQNYVGLVSRSGQLTGLTGIGTP
ncbi:MAG TPA: carbohydrate binding family 9 domain-containing protein, partial [Longimicrobiaceae bacterium]